MVRFEAADLPEEKKQVLEEIADEWDVKIKVVGNGYSEGVLEKLFSRRVKKARGVAASGPIFGEAVWLSGFWMDDCSLAELEIVALHEVGHIVDYRLGIEEFAERFAAKHFSGSIEEFQEASTNFWYKMKTNEGWSEDRFGEDFV